MSILFMEGFGAAAVGNHPPGALEGLRYNWAQWEDIATDLAVAALSSGVQGTRNYVTFPGVVDLYSRALTPSATITVGFRVYRANTNICHCVKLGVNGYIGIDASGFVRYTRDNGGGLNDAGESWGSDTALAEGVYNFVEVKVTFGNGTAGAVEFYVDGQAAGSQSGIDTVSTLAGASVDGVGYIQMGYSASGGVDPDFRFTDIYVSTGEVLGPVEVWWQPCVVAGSDADFTPSAGSNHENVDDPDDPDGDATYNESSATGSRDALGHSVTHTLGPTAVMPVAMVRASTEGTARVRVGVRSGLVDSWGEAIHAGSLYAAVSGPIQETDPSDGSDWSASGADAAETAIEHVA